MRRQRQKQHRCSGYTLLEVSVALVGASMLMTALSSAVFLAMRATDASSLATKNAISGEFAVETLLSDLEFAILFTEKTATSITFQVPDRDGDDGVETIRYAWSGTPGDPLTREYNGGAATTIAENVHEFAHSLPTSTGNLLLNADMEAGTAGWEPIPNATMNHYTSTYRSAVACLECYRNSKSDESGLRQNVSGVIVNGQKYDIGAYMRKWANSSPYGAVVMLRVTSSGEGEQVFKTNSFDVNNSAFEHVYGTVTPVWTGTLTSAYFEVSGVASIQELYVDDAYMQTSANSPQYVDVRLQIGSNRNGLIHSGVPLVNEPH